MQIIALLSAILWLGNVRFEVAAEERVLAAQDEALRNAASLLGVSKIALSSAITSRNIVAGAPNKWKLAWLRYREDGTDLSIPKGRACASPKAVAPFSSEGIIEKFRSISSSRNSFQDEDSESREESLPVIISSKL